MKQINGSWVNLDSDHRTEELSIRSSSLTLVKEHPRLVDHFRDDLRVRDTLQQMFASFARYVGPQPPRISWDCGE
jgi:hypothetical protein